MKSWSVSIGKAARRDASVITGEGPAAWSCGMVLSSRKAVKTKSTRAPSPRPEFGLGANPPVLAPRQRPTTDFRAPPRERPGHRERREYEDRRARVRIRSVHGALKGDTAVVSVAPGDLALL